MRKPIETDVEYNRVSKSDISNYLNTELKSPKRKIENGQSLMAKNCYTFKKHRGRGPRIWRLIRRTDRKAKPST